LHPVFVQGDIMLDRLAPLRSGRDTEIDMIEREMEGGVVVIQPPEVHEHSVDERVGGLISIEEDVEVRELVPKPSVVSKA
jgi:hypothetical protein